MLHCLKEKSYVEKNILKLFFLLHSPESVDSETVSHSPSFLFQPDLVVEIQPWLAVRR